MCVQEFWSTPTENWIFFEKFCFSIANLKMISQLLPAVALGILLFFIIPRWLLLWPQKYCFHLSFDLNYKEEILLSLILTSQALHAGRKIVCSFFYNWIALNSRRLRSMLLEISSERVSDERLWLILYLTSEGSFSDTLLSLKGISMVTCNTSPLWERLIHQPLEKYCNLYNISRWIK